MVILCRAYSILRICAQHTVILYFCLQHTAAHKKTSLPLKNRAHRQLLRPSPRGRASAAAGGRGPRRTTRAGEGRLWCSSSRSSSPASAPSSRRPRRRGGASPLLPSLQLRRERGGLLDPELRRCPDPELRRRRARGGGRSTAGAAGAASLRGRASRARGRRGAEVPPARQCVGGSDPHRRRGRARRPRRRGRAPARAERTELPSANGGARPPLSAMDWA